MQNETTQPNEPIATYGSIRSGANHDLLEHEVVIQEKVDGSQISFGRVRNEVIIRSKGQIIDQDNPGSFSKAVEAIRSVAHTLLDNVVYRGEYLRSEKHNVLKYGRIPKNHIVIFDIGWRYPDGQIGYYLPVTWEMGSMTEATMRFFEAAPTLAIGKFDYSGLSSRVEDLLQKESFLGGPKIEGVVIKNYGNRDQSSRPYMAKIVSSEFKEMHTGKARVPKVRENVIQQLCGQLTTEARWRKAIQRGKDEGIITGTPKDIGYLVRSVQEDVLDECIDHITETLVEWARPQIVTGVVSGLALWYKKLLEEEELESATAKPEVTE